MTDGFMDGYQNEIPSQSGWRPGQTTTLHQVIICPRCGSVRVGPKDNGASDKVARWECRDCGEAFKRAAGTAMRVYINAIDN